MKINKTRTRLPWAPLKKAKPFERSAEKVKEDQAFYNTADWRKLAATYRDEPCEICKAAGRLRMMYVLDHIIRWQAGGSRLDRRNLMPVCKSCHNRKSGMEKHREILIETVMVDGELLPKDREDIFKIVNG